MISYSIARQSYLRGLGALYVICALILFFQGKLLIGEFGLMPVPIDLPDAWNYPSLLFFFPGDATIVGMALAMGAAGLALLFGFCNWLLLLVLYVSQVSLVNGGGIFYGFGWETMMCEMTFLSIFITHPYRIRVGGPKYFPVSWWNMIFFWGLLFKLMVGAGLIKIRGDACWSELTCMDYHYQTQPNPHFLSWYFHNLPWWFHRFETGFNHFIELLIPFGLLLNQKIRRAAGAWIGLFQILLISTGNLAFINWQTLVLTATCFDDAVWMRVWKKAGKVSSPFRVWQKYFVGAGVVLVLFLNFPVFRNFLSSRQSMNESYSRWHLVNTYGLFGSISKERYEIVFSGTRDSVLTLSTKWEEYEFYCKPGRIDRRPCWITPYHLRLDWQLWFSAMRPELQERYLTNLAEMMLRNDISLEALGIENPFRGGPAPVQVKMDLYRYQFTSPDEGNSNWWRREFIKPYMLPARFQ